MFTPQNTTMKKHHLFLLIAMSLAPVFGQAQTIKNDTQVEADVLKKAEPLIGFTNLFQTLADEIGKPKYRKGITSDLLIVNFIIDANGDVAEVNFSKGEFKNDYYKDDIIKLFSTSGKWKPAQKNGIDVQSEFTLPIRLNQ